VQVTVGHWQVKPPAIPLLVTESTLQLLISDATQTPPFNLKIFMSERLEIVSLFNVKRAIAVFFFFMSLFLFKYIVN
jgi:hypothetical protein